MGSHIIGLTRLEYSINNKMIRHLELWHSHLVMGKFEFRTSLDEFGGSSLYSFVFEFTLIHKNEFG